MDSQKFVEHLDDRPDLLSQSDRSIIFVLHRDHASTTNEEHENNIHRYIVYVFKLCSSFFQFTIS